MSSIIASHIPATISNQKLQEFFGFCGKIKSINLIDKSDKLQTFEINFESPKALSTAVLLNDAELEGVPIKVEESKGSSLTSTANEGSAVPAAPGADALASNLGATRNISSGEPPQYSEVAASGVGSGAAGAGAAGDHKVQSSDATYTGDDAYDDIGQEEKPKSAILAQLLAQGYNVSDSLIEKSIKFDQERGYTASFKNFLANLDSKYIHSQEPNSTTNKGVSTISDKLSSLTNKFQGSTYQQKLNHYFDQAAQHPYGAKIHDFYKNLAKDVNDVHNEARRLNELKKEKQLESPQATANAAAAINTAN